MGTYRGKSKAKAGQAETRQAPAEFSEDSDAEFSEDDVSENDEVEEDVILSAAEDDEEDEDEDDEDEDDEEEALHWGSKKSAFFKEAGSSEEEDEEDEELAEEEALKMLKKRQSALKQEDLELGGDEDEEEDERTGPLVVRKSRKSSKKSAAEDEDELLATEAPEVLALLGEFGAKANEIRDSIQPILERLKHDRESCTKEGVAYLETKTHLLLSYVLNVAFYLLYRAENGAAKAESHPVVGQLVRLRTLLDKLRPLDAKLKNELDELVRRAVASISTTEEEDDEEQHEEDDEDGRPGARSDSTSRNGNKPITSNNKLSFRPDFKDLIRNSNGLDEEEDRYEAKERKKAEREERRRMARAESSSLVKELREELTDAPTEILDEMRLARGDSKYDEEKRRYEEENFTRIRETKKMKAKLGHKSDSKTTSIHGGDLNVLAEELTEGEFTKFKDLLEDDDDNGNGGKSTKKGSLSMHLNEMEQARKGKNKSAFLTGDDDVMPTRRKLPESRRPAAVTEEEEDQPFKKGRRSGDAEFEDDNDIQVDEKAEHPYFQETVKRRKLASKEKEESYQFPKRFAPAPVRIVEAGESRPASRDIIKNRGLTAHRSRDKKNPRKNIRDKYEAKVKARRGQVRDVRTGEGDNYQGEKSGIRSSVVRSRRAGKI